MIPIRTSNTDLILGAPADWNAEKNGPCEGLPICKNEDMMHSYWKPDWRERIKLIFGYPIRLTIFGFRHPPVTLDLEN